MGCGRCLKENTDGPADMEKLEPDQCPPDEYFWTLVNHYEKLNKQARQHLSLHFLTKVGQKVKPSMDNQIDTSVMNILQPQKMMSRNSNLSELNTL